MAFQVTLKPSGHTFVVPDGKRVLEAGLKAGVFMPHNCKGGLCSTCKGRVLEGAVDFGNVLPKYLPDSEKATGHALLCQAKPLSDLVIELNELGGLEGVRTREVPCRVIKLERAAPDVVVMQLRLPMNENLRFAGGQHLEFILKDGQRRAYSIATAPSPEGVIGLELHVRHVPGGLFTDHVFSALKERDLLRFEGPLGTFFLREESPKPIILLAGGTGFAPIKSIVLSALNKKISRPMTLYWGGRKKADLYQFELAQKWAEENPHFKFVPVLSDASAACDWAGRTGFVHHAVMQDHPDLSGYQVYACGAPVMVDAAKNDFTKECRLLPDEFFADSFLTEADRAL
ncbi:CDP-6-deoxy-delta-3,4-glucoseen reductase [Ferribacterium limneticum]|uniref:CDP-6-deoxy-delta-3,4-glucoseen reductase n=1 Tax=Ferribacterium limneticum TaxID=76259 RepID=UPI001CFB1223|nr:CDP-6-deoxy-delta-3,4-glucoseen reductase [Ferribacterium limneticum]UCV17847.1 CDP-6-deoxy-delta-3,4-glucoseen reductase [Ferribacterium limneticum]